MSLRDSFLDDVGDPKGFLASHRITVRRQPLPKLANEIYTIAVVNAHARKFTPKAGVFLDLEIASGGAGGTEEMKFKIAPVDRGIRYLPYDADGATFTDIDPAATHIFTGPIEGCFVYVAVNGKTITLYHANANANAGDDNADTKDGYVRAVLNGAHPTHRLTFAHYKTTASDVQGFVYGWKDDSNWRWHVSSLKLGPSKFEKHLPSITLPPCSTI